MVKLSLFPVLFKKKLLEDTEKVFFFKFSFLFLVKILKYAGQAVLALWSLGLFPLPPQISLAGYCTVHHHQEHICWNSRMDGSRGNRLQEPDQAGWHLESRLHHSGDDVRRHPVVAQHGGTSQWCVFCIGDAISLAYPKEIGGFCVWFFFISRYKNLELSIVN